MVCATRTLRLTLMFTPSVSGIWLARQVVVENKGVLRLQRWTFNALGAYGFNFNVVARARPC